MKPHERIEMFPVVSSFLCCFFEVDGGEHLMVPDG